MQSSNREVITDAAALQRGLEAGTSALEAQELVDLAREAQLLRVEVPDELASFGQGYTQGLIQFLQTHKIDTRLLGLYSSPEALRMGAALEAYLQGMRRESPGIARQYSSYGDSGLKEILNIKKIVPETEWQISDRVLTWQRRGGYKLGFLVGVARDYNITLNPYDAPYDNLAYQASCRA